MKKETKNKGEESVVLVGGGGGVYRIAKFLKYVRGNITTVQTIFDHGGHSGELRDERGVLPPGDIRQAIVALSDEEIEGDLRALLTHRFSPHNGSSLDGATVGNILLTALTEITGNPVSAINVLSRWFRVKGRVLPVSLDDCELCALLNDGSVLVGEGKIDKRSENDKRKIKKVFLSPPAEIYREVPEAIVAAHKIVFCPGDLYTSLIPCTLVRGFKEALGRSKAKLIYVTNIMTKKAETDGFKASDFAKELLRYIGQKRFDTIIVNTGEVRKNLLEEYEKQRAHPVVCDISRLKSFAKNIVPENFVDDKGEVVRHNQRVASIIARL